MVDPTSLNLGGPAAAGYIYQTDHRPAVFQVTWPLDHHQRKQQPHMWVRASRSWLSTRSRGPINSVARYTYTVEYTEQHPPCIYIYAYLVAFCIHVADDCWWTSMFPVRSPSRFWAIKGRSVLYKHTNIVRYTTVQETVLLLAAQDNDISWIKQIQVFIKKIQVQVGTAAWSLTHLPYVCSLIYIYNILFAWTCLAYACGWNIWMHITVMRMSNHLKNPIFILWV
jgi:hypothetical protein